MKKKLNLQELKVKSFITEDINGNSIKGGNVTIGCGNTFDYCRTVPVNECNVPSYNANCPTVPVANCNTPTLDCFASIDTSCIDITMACINITNVC